MAVKGQALKGEITQKILAAFPGSFLYNDGKEIRIDGMEAGERVQIKVTLTASKTPVDNDGTITVISTGDKPEKIEFENSGSVRTIEPNEPTEEEKKRLKTLLENLGL